jgi:hypothetical protein
MGYNRKNTIQNTTNNNPVGQNFKNSESDLNRKNIN